MKRHSQQGSALLIVLGFLSFMVVSAVAFAIWMRNERLPSSALRRSVATRYLVKAALAQAMSRVDDAIRSHAYPGAWYTNEQNKVYRDMNNQAYDWWESRVFMPPDPEGVKTPDSSKINFPRTAPATKTVSVLNLEALGYLPPAIANDVRLLSRSSWAAKWDYFNYDAGRYAFCAVNVSDFLDITKIAADSPRTSAAAARAQSSGQTPPPSRFSLAYLFRSSTRPDSDDFSSASGMSQFDQYVHTSPATWSSAPLVSIMDYNLSVGPNTMGTLESPFYKMITVNNSRYFYNGEIGANASSVKGAERQPFVTASWFPPSETLKIDDADDTPLDISRQQPFLQGFGLRKTENQGQGISGVLFDASNPKFWDAAMKYGHAFCWLDKFTLFDYLDENDVPLSLAMPCTERVPMITALAPAGDVKVEFEAMAMVGEPEKDTGKQEWRETSEAKIKITFGAMALKSVIAYPFKDAGTPKNSTAQAFARLVFVGSDPAAAGAAAGAAGTAAGVPTLRSDTFAQNFRPMNEAEWSAAVDKDEGQFKLQSGNGDRASRTEVKDCLLVTLPAMDESCTPNSNIRDVEGCFRDCWTDSKSLLLQDPGDLTKPILRKVDVYELVSQPAAGGTVTYTKGPLKDSYYQVLLNPFDINGNVLNVMDGYQNPSGYGISSADFAALCTKYTISPCLVTWARVVQDGKTVDMVPATYEDDKVFNNVNNREAADDLNVADVNYPLGNTQFFQSGNRAHWPIMRFPGTMTFTYAEANTATAPAVNPNQWAVKSCYAVDPRFNWAPENWWFDAGDANPTGKKWRDAVFGTKDDGTDDACILNKLVADEFDNAVPHRGDRAHDPFLFVSNLGYLQSVGELAFLPRLSDMSENRDPMSGLGADKNEDFNQDNRSLYNGQPRDLANFTADGTRFPCARAAWKFYQNYHTNPNVNTFEFGANLYRRGLVNGSQGFYVNPYTQSQEVMLAALANTPLNYFVAGTNTLIQKESGISISKFGDYKPYTFSDNSSLSAPITGRDMNKVATFLRRRFEDLASMIVLPDGLSLNDWFVYQKVWEDMFDALDWSGMLEDLTVERLYDTLDEYYNGSEASSANYLAMYKRGNENSYSDLNHFARGGGKKPLTTRISLNKDRAIYKDDFNLSADPLRGQYAGNTSDTSCWDRLHDVDRMFLHSYWRDCFANRQQLFLIFVRAESTALGGAGEGTPAQQGGRAVALVWRDPLPPFDTTANPPVLAQDVVELDNTSVYEPQRHPHKMRVLFYRQFD